MENYLRFVAALIVVIALIGAAAWLVRRFGLAGHLPSVRARGARRLSMVEFMAIDPKTRLVLVQRDKTQHLILLAAAGPLIVERGIAVTPETNDIEAAE